MRRDYVSNLCLAAPGGSEADQHGTGDAGPARGKWSPTAARVRRQRFRELLDALDGTWTSMSLYREYSSRMALGLRVDLCAAVSPGHLKRVDCVETESIFRKICFDPVQLCWSPGRLRSSFITTHGPRWKHETSVLGFAASAGVWQLWQASRSAKSSCSVRRQAGEAPSTISLGLVREISCFTYVRRCRRKTVARLSRRGVQKR